MTVLTAPATAHAAALRLRPWRPDDLPALLAAHRDPEMRRRLATSLTDEAEARRWLDRQVTGWADGTRFGFAVVAPGDDGSPLGHVVLKMADAEVGYWTAAHARGQGIAVRAVDAVSRWAFATLALTRLELLHVLDNTASCRVAMKTGFTAYTVVPASPPQYTKTAHRHVRTAA